MRRRLVPNIHTSDSAAATRSTPYQKEPLVIGPSRKPEERNAGDDSARAKPTVPCREELSAERRETAGSDREREGQRDPRTSGEIRQHEQPVGERRITGDRRLGEHAVDERREEQEGRGRATAGERHWGESGGALVEAAKPHLQIGDEREQRERRERVKERQHADLRAVVQEVGLSADRRRVEPRVGRGADDVAEQQAERKQEHGEHSACGPPPMRVQAIQETPITVSRSLVTNIRISLSGRGCWKRGPPLPPDPRPRTQEHP